MNNEYKPVLICIGSYKDFYGDREYSERKHNR